MSVNLTAARMVLFVPPPNIRLYPIVKSKYKRKTNKRFSRVNSRPSNRAKPRRAAVNRRCVHKTRTNRFHARRYANLTLYLRTNQFTHNFSSFRSMPSTIRRRPAAKAFSQISLIRCSTKRRAALARQPAWAAAVQT